MCMAAVAAVAAAVAAVETALAFAVRYRARLVEISKLALVSIFQNLNQNTLGFMVYQNASKYFRFGIKILVI